MSKETRYLKIKDKLSRIESEEIYEYRKACEAILMERLYGLGSRPFSDDIQVVNFFDRNILVAKDDVPLGKYLFHLRPPEHSSLKIDLRTEVDHKIRQIRICFTQRDWERLAGR